MASKKKTKIENDVTQEELQPLRLFVSGGNFDYTTLFLTIAICAFGVMMVYSSSSYRAILNGYSANHFAYRQALFAIAGLVAMLIVSRVNYRLLQHFSKLLMLLSICLCLYVLINGSASGGAVRWISFGSLRFQPSELAKPAIAIYTASMCTEHQSWLKDLKGIFKIMVAPAFCSGLILTENLSTGAICLAIAAAIVFTASPKTKMLVLIAVGLVGVLAIFLVSASYRLTRVKAWLHPEKYPDDTYQTLQGLYAIGSGGIFGRGLGQSIQKTGNLPESHNDMIFAIICEELGFFGAILLIVAFVMLLLRLMRISKKSFDMLGGLIVVGIMTHIGVQFAINIAVVTNTMPNTGVTLPFVSYGGTSLFFLMIEIGIVLSVSRQQKFVNG